MVTVGPKGFTLGLPTCCPGVRNQSRLRSWQHARSSATEHRSSTQEQDDGTDIYTCLLAAHKLRAYLLARQGLPWTAQIRAAPRVADRLTILIPPSIGLRRTMT